MREGSHRASLMVLSGMALALTIASIAWACTGTHSGNTWLCATGSPSCSISFRAQTPDNDLTYYSNASGLDATTDYFVKYAAGDHSPDEDEECEVGSIFSLSGGGGDANFTTNISWAWSAQGPMVMPSGATGTYTICAVPEDTGGNGSQHALITLVE